MKLRERLDGYGMDAPANNEGFPEDRCSVCEVPVIDHPCLRHRVWAALDILLGGGKP